MGFCKVLCQLSIGLLVSFIGFLIFAAYNAGQFEEIETFGQDKCESISVPTPNQSCEDLQVLSDNSILVSCGYLYNALFPQTVNIPYLTNYKNMNSRISLLSQENKGIGTVHIITKESSFKQSIELKMYGYSHPDFHPHGMSVVNVNGIDFVYIVNHRRDGEFISVFKIDRKNKKLKYWTSIYSDSFAYVNNVAIIPNTNGDFYHTNWLKNEPGSWSAIGETLGAESAMASDAQFCETPTDFLNKRPKGNVKVKCHSITGALPDANGIELDSKNDKLYVVVGIHLHEYQVFNDNRNVKLIQKFNLGMPCDNVNASPTDQDTLSISCFPKPFSGFYKMTFGHINTINAAIFSVNTNDVNDEENKSQKAQQQSTNEKTKNANTKKDNKITPILLDMNGQTISGCTGAIKVGNYIVGVSIFDHSRYVVCNTK